MSRQLKETARSQVLAFFEAGMTVNEVAFKMRKIHSTFVRVRHNLLNKNY